MEEQFVNFDIEKADKPIIKVIGVGGGGSNAVNHMYHQGITNVDFVVCNTDLQALAKSPVPNKIQLGRTLSEGRGAGNDPDKGRAAAVESADDIERMLSDGTKMVFITAGMGGGTGTGAAPVIAQTAFEMGILTVAIVTIPFTFEGPKRIKQAVDGIARICDYVDSIIVIRNERLREEFGDMPMTEAFNKANDILKVAAKGIAEIITVPGFINVDFEDVQTVMKSSGVALMGTAEAEGDDRAVKAAEMVLKSPLLNNNDITGAKNMLISLASSSQSEITIAEFEAVGNYLSQRANCKVDIIWGSTLDESLGSKVQLTVIATGFNAEVIPELLAAHNAAPQRRVVVMDDPADDIPAEPAHPSGAAPAGGPAGNPANDFDYTVPGQRSFWAEPNVKELEEVPTFLRWKGEKGK